MKLNKQRQMHRNISTLPTDLQYTHVQCREPIKGSNFKEDNRALPICAKEIRLVVST